MLNSANAARKPRKPLGTNETFWGYVFLAPVIIGFLVFTAVPVVVSLYYSLTNYDGITAPKFVGLSNYIDLFQNGEFGHALLNSVYFTIGTVPLGAFLALLVAILLNQKIKAQSLYRSAFFIPCIVSYVAIAMVWQWMYNQDYGITIGHKRKKEISAMINNFCRDYKAGIIWSLNEVQIVFGNISHLGQIEPEYRKTLVKKYETKYGFDPEEKMKKIM